MSSASLRALVAGQRDENTIAWLPTFLTDEETRLLGHLVILNSVLHGEKWAARDLFLKTATQIYSR